VVGRVLAAVGFANAGFLRGGASSSSSSEDVSNALLLRFRETSCLSFEGFELALAVGLLGREPLLTELMCMNFSSEHVRSDRNLRHFGVRV
jgi:hypothetical protein